METTYNKHSHHNFQKIVHSDRSGGTGEDPATT